LLVINVYQLYKLQQSNEQFQYVTFEQDDKIVGKFIEFYKNDIKQFFPNFEIIPLLAFL
jgi:hypothetical protein